MADLRRGSLDQQPAVKATTANKQLMQKNLRASDNWIRAKHLLDREKRQYESKMSMDKNALLKQRDRLQKSTSLTLDTVHEVHDNVSVESTPRLAPPSQDNTKRRMTLADVYDSLIKSVREQKHSSNGDNRSVQSEPTNLLQASTASFDNKKVIRKPAKFTLQSLQRAQSNLQDKLQALANTHNETDNDSTNETQSEPTTPRGYFDLSESERSLGPKLRLPPTTLPPIRSQAAFKPRSRSFERPSVPPQVGDEDMEDIKYCRYIRGAARTARRNSAPAVRPGMVLKRHKINQ